MFRLHKKILGLFISIFFIASTSYADKIERSGFLSNLRELKEISEVIDLINANHVGDKEINKKILMQGAIDGMIKALEDPYSNYFNEKELKDFKEDIKGKYVGVGLVIQKKVNEPITVVSPIEDGPAFRAGVRPKDKILEINGESVYKLNAEESSKKLKGKKNTKIRLKVYREKGNITKEFSFNREEITLKYVKYKMLENKIGYLRITQFGEEIMPDINSAIDNLKNQGMEKLILDLRSNPGGDIKPAVKISSLFIKEGKIVSLKEKGGNEKIYSREGDYLGEIPLVILVNGGSASASEIVSGAIKDHKRGILIGEKTFGKGSVQTLIPLPDGDGIKLTIARYYTPAGISIHGKGIDPDILVEDDEYYLISDGLITNVDEKEAKKDKKELVKKVIGEKEAEKVETHKDIQLKKAIDFLNGKTTLEKEKERMEKEKLAKDKEKKDKDKKDKK